MTNTLEANPSLSDLFVRMSDHLDGLAAEVHAIEHAIGDEMDIVVAQDGETIMRLQRLDFLRQSLEDMALLSNFLSKDHDGILQTNLAQQMRLDVTKRLICGGEPPSDKIRQEDAIGDVDLF